MTDHRYLLRVCFGMVQFKAWDYAHGHVTLFTLEGCGLPPPSFLVAADYTVVLELTARR